MRDIFVFLFGPVGRQVYSTTFDGIEWFPAVQVCRLLGYADVSSATRGWRSPWLELRDDEKRKFKDYDYNKYSEVWFISESGFWKLLAASDTWTTLRIKIWLCTRILPSLLHRVIDEEIAERGYDQFM